MDPRASSTHVSHFAKWPQAKDWPQALLRKRRSEELIVPSRQVLIEQLTLPLLKLRERSVIEGTAASTHL